MDCEPVKKIPRNTKVFINTNNGPILLKKLKKGCKVQNRKIETVLCSSYYGNLICFSKNSLAKNVPCRTTYLEPETLIFINNMCIPAKKFIGINCISCLYVYDHLTYYILFKGKSPIKYLHNNVVVESYDPKGKLAKKYFKKKKDKKKDKIKKNKTISDIIFDIAMRIFIMIF